ncbi:SpoIIE family protein phosphatase [Streptomyces sp. NPDC002785]|uniref:SpoIIE family protein phosphatase n=1 Tax=Streptomyces sp. NPDC002785 TaxID=3154543 RepID=UPI00331AA9DA
MSFESTKLGSCGPFNVAPSAAVVLDARGTVIGWSPAAEELFGYASKEALGSPVGDLLGDTVRAAPPQEPGNMYAVRSVLHRDGRTVRVALLLSPLEQDEGVAAWLLSAVGVAHLEQWASDQAVLRGLSDQSSILITLYDTQSRFKWINTAVEKQFGLTAEDCVGRYVADVEPHGEILVEDGDGVPAPGLQRLIERVVRTGEPITDVRYRTPIPADPQHDHFWSFCYFRLQDHEGRPLGVCEAGLDITDRYVARQRLALLSGAGGRIGGTLDVERTAGNLADLAVPEFADLVQVDLLEPVLRGEEPGPWTDKTAHDLRRVAERVADHERPAAAASPRPIEYPPDSPQPRCLAHGHSVTSDQVVVVPLRAWGTALGLATFERFPPRDPFDPEEIALAEELVSRTAVCVDNGRRYAREHAIALMLQHDLLPHRLAQPAAVEVAHRYLPAAGPVGVGGDWYDVIPLSGARVGLVVGDVAGHGMRAAVTMGRMRTTVAALAAMDLAPDELLARLDDLVAQSLGGEDDQAVGVTCLYAIYDPVEQHCVMARAGHLPPAVVAPDGRVEILDLPAGPPLGLGGLPFESVGFDLPEDRLLALFTDGLVEARDRDIDIGLNELRDALSIPGRQLEETCDSVMSAVLPKFPEDDAALLLVRVHALSDDQVASWDLPVDPAEVARFRALAVQKVAEWGHNEAVSVIELVVSELVTNAIRYGGAPVRLRLIRDRGLICEVSDGGHTSPHLRWAAQEDEGGRGLFLVAQLTERWGTRYTPHGKTIWAEVPLDARPCS